METPAHRIDNFNGDDAHLISCIDALLDLSDGNALVGPGFGKGHHAYRLLSAARHRLSRREDAEREGLREAIVKVRDGYKSQMKFCDIEALGYFREFVRRIDAALAQPSSAPAAVRSLALSRQASLAMIEAYYAHPEIDEHGFLPPDVAWLTMFDAALRPDGDAGRERVLEEALPYAEELHEIAGMLAQLPDGPTRWKQYRLVAIADYLAALATPAGEPQDVEGRVREFDDLLEAADLAHRKCMSAWSCGEPYHRVKDMMSAVEALGTRVAALRQPADRRSEG